MDWGTSDYTQTYADTLYVSEPEAWSGVSLLDPSDRDTEAEAARRPHAPFTYYGHPAGRYGTTIRPPQQATPYNAAAAQYHEGFRASRRAGKQHQASSGHREGFHRGASPGGINEAYYTGGNIQHMPGDENLAKIYNGSWDPRPMHYNPNAGPESAHLVPDPALRPYGGGPAPSLAFPLMTTSEAMMKQESAQYPNAGMDHFSVRSLASSLSSIQVIQLVLFFVIIVLLSLVLVHVGHIDKKYQAMMTASLVRGGPAS